MFERIADLVSDYWEDIATVAVVALGSVAIIGWVVFTFIAWA